MLFFYIIIELIIIEKSLWTCIPKLRQRLTTTTTSNSITSTTTIELLVPLIATTTIFVVKILLSLICVQGEMKSSRVSFVKLHARTGPG